MISFLFQVTLAIRMIDSSSTELPIRFFTYNVMRGRYSCYKEQLKENEHFRRSISIEKISSQTDFVRTNLATIANHLRHYHPDIIALQEIQESPSTVTMNNEISTATYLSQQLDMIFTFSPTLFDNDVQMQYGTAVLVNPRRFRVITVEILSLPLGLEPRNSPCLTIQCRFSNITFRACSIHFDHHSTDNSIRLQQADTFIRWLKKEPYYPTVLLGDFNDNRTSLTMKNLYESFFDDHSLESSRPTWSECGENLKDKIDYILLDRRSSWTINEFIHGTNLKKLFPSIDLTMLSDHVPLFAQTSLRVEKKK